MRFCRPIGWTTPKRPSTRCRSCAPTRPCTRCIAEVLTRKKDYEQALNQLQVYFDAKESREELAPYELLEQVLGACRGSKSCCRSWKQFTRPIRKTSSWAIPCEAIPSAEQWAKAEPIYQELLKRSPKVEAYRGLIRIYRHTRQTGSLLDTLASAVENTGGLEGLDKETTKIARDNELLTAIIRAA